MKVFHLQSEMNGYNQEGESRPERMRQRMRSSPLGSREVGPPLQRGLGVAHLERLRLQERLRNMNVSGVQISDDQNLYRHALLSQVPPNILRDQHSASNRLHQPVGGLVRNNNDGAGHQLSAGFISRNGGTSSNGGSVGFPPVGRIQFSGTEPLSFSRNKMSVDPRHLRDNCQFGIQEHINGVNTECMETIPKGVCGDCDLELSIGTNTNNHGDEVMINKDCGRPNKGKEVMEIQTNTNTVKQGGNGGLMGYSGFFPLGISRSYKGESSSSAAAYNKDLFVAERAAAPSSTTTTATDSNGDCEVLDLTLRLSCGF